MCYRWKALFVYSTCVEVIQAHSVKLPPLEVLSLTVVTMRPMLNLFFIFGSSVGFYSGPMMRRMSSAAAFGSLAGTQFVRAVNAVQTAPQCGSTQQFSTAMTAAEFVDKEVEGNNVVIFSKSYCPFCARTKQLFKSLNVEHKIHELDLRDDGPIIQEALMAKTAQTTVPNVFVKGTHVGGNDAVQAANASGALKKLLDG